MRTTDEDPPIEALDHLAMAAWEYAENPSLAALEAVEERAAELGLDYTRMLLACHARNEALIGAPAESALARYEVARALSRVANKYCT